MCTLQALNSMCSQSLLTQSRFTVRRDKSKWLWEIWSAQFSPKICSQVDMSILGGPEGLRALTNPKAIIYDRWPWLFQTAIPKPLDYPIRSPLKAWWVLLISLMTHIHQIFLETYRDVASGIVGALYADGWRQSFESLQRLINAVRS